MNKKNSDYVGVFFSVYLWLKEGKCNHYERNTDFLASIGIPEKRQIYVSKITPTVIAIISEEELNKAKADVRLSDWSIYDFEEPENAREDILLTQIGADSTRGTISMGYTGKGIKVGVIAAENYIFDKNALSLIGANVTVLPSVLPPKTNTHPTAVVSQIVGQKVNVANTEFSGVVSDADLFFASAKTSKNVFSAIEEMAELGVKVINYSAGIVKGEYSDFDRQIDRLTKAGNFLFVTVSGNTRNMTSPGRTQNGVAVGNLVTKDYPNTPLVQPWNVWCQSEESCSGYNDSGVHKPDLVAPGAWIGYAENENSVNFNNFGTSFACPWVSGIAVAVIQALNREHSYLSVKAILLMSCNPQAVSDSENPFITEHIRLRSGYGMLDGIRAVEIAQKCEIYESRLDGEYNVEIEGGNLKIMLVFEKGEGSVTVTLDGDSFDTGEQNTLLIEKRLAATDNARLSQAIPTIKKTKWREPNYRENSYKVEKRSKESVYPLSVIGIGGRFSLVIFRSF